MAGLSPNDERNAPAGKIAGCCPRRAHGRGKRSVRQQVGQSPIREDDWRLASADSIPSTLRGSLAARLDRLKVAKPLAQIVATLGRVFDGEVLSAVTGESQAVLGDQLAELLRDDFLQQHGMLAQAKYSFRHALIQDAAYDSLLKSERQALHRKIAEVLSGQFPAVVAATPEVVAQHYTAANLIEPAILHWEAAGKKKGCGALGERGGRQSFCECTGCAAAPP